MIPQSGNERRKKSEFQILMRKAFSDFELLVSFDIRHSTFVIRGRMSVFQPMI